MENQLWYMSGSTFYEGKHDHRIGTLKPNDSNPLYPHPYILSRKKQQIRKQEIYEVNSNYCLCNNTSILVILYSCISHLCR